MRAAHHILPPALALALALGSACVAPSGAKTDDASAPPVTPAPSTPIEASASPRPERGLLMPWIERGCSLEGRPIEVAKFGDGPRRVLIIGGIHGDEREGQVATEALQQAFLDASLAAHASVLLIRDLNPDGTARQRRGSSSGVDLNRNFPATSFRPSRRRGMEPLDQPETRLLAELIDEHGPQLVIALHSATSRAFINFDGPASLEAELFAARADWPLVISDELHSTPGSLGSWLGRDRAIGVLTVEYRKGSDAEECWERTRTALLEAIAGEALVPASNQ